MKSLIKVSCGYMFSIFLAIMCSVSTFAVKTPCFDSLTSNFQYILRKYGEYEKNCWKYDETIEKIAEWGLDGSNVEIDGSYCYRGLEGWCHPKPKLTNEDIESLNNLKKMEALTLSNFDLTEVDVTKFLDIDTDKKMIFLCLSGCKFDKDYDEIRRMLRRDGYIVGDGPEIWITWPGIDPDDIFLRGRLGGQK